jgi:nitrogen fixation/metabolism regulation signal transduction histidine kinase
MTMSFKMVRNLGLAIIIMIIVVMGIFSFLSKEKIIDGLSAVLKEKNPTLENIASIREDFLNAREIFIVFSRGEREDVGLAIALMNKVIEKASALHNTVAEKDRDEVAKFITAAKRFKMAVSVYAKEIKVDPTGSSALDMEKLAMTTVKETNAALGKMINDVRASIKASDINALIVAKKSQKLILISVLVAVAAGLLVAFFMGKALTKPISQLVDATKHIAQGDLAYRINVNSEDEIGQLAHAFNKMAEDLSSSLKKERERVVDKPASD